MEKYAIKSIDTELLDCSTRNERNYIFGDSKIILHKWETKSSAKYFEESRASIKFSALPQSIQNLYLQFEKELIAYLIN